MWGRDRNDHSDATAVLAVLEAAAREAQELLAVEVDIEPATEAEAKRRIQLLVDFVRDRPQ
jgi:hypothetical protein